MIEVILPEGLEKIDDHAFYGAKLLEAVKTEFNNFAGALEEARKKVDSAGKSLNTLVTTRTNVMQRAMKDITTLDDGSEKEILGIEDIPELTE